MMKTEIYKDEGYRFMGAAFEVYNDRGYGLAEEIYQEVPRNRTGNARHIVPPQGRDPMYLQRPPTEKALHSRSFCVRLLAGGVEGRNRSCARTRGATHQLHAHLPTT